MFETCDNCDHRPIHSRRDFLSRLGMGFGALGLSSLLSQDFLTNVSAAENLSPLAPKLPPFPAKAKRVIHIFANGAPSQVDT
ncbi:MAG: twin-arginine translocation signal domain-containing protein, partial [Verrucomicrobiota bacterium]